MGTIGNFGSRIIFETSDRRILTFSGMTQKISGKYAKHSIIGQKDRAEFTGPGNRSVSFKIILDVSMGIRPREIMDSIETAVETGEVEYLVIGGRPVGSNKYYISSVSEAMDVVMGRGEIVRATLNISMEEYV
ncbi:MAG: phage tail protein [Lachnospiraceae bacterium]|nr:phage tail protein [Lachnospiraceae bacterium]